jgi:uncharacterized protein
MADDPRADTIEVLRRAGASFALVFGSQARGDHRPDSDLDVAAWWAGAAPQSWEVPVPARVDLVVLRPEMSIELAGRIALEGAVLFDDDPSVRVEWVATTRKIWLDERPRWQRGNRRFLEAVTDGR